MFTGLVEEVGEVLAVRRGNQSRRLTIRSRLVASDVRIGGSVAVDGVCLTAVDVRAGRISVDVVAETLRRTTLGALAPGIPVNLERPVRADQRLGGHVVQGHVDGVGTIVSTRAEGEGVWMGITVSPTLRKYLVEKGSVAVHGVSLTVAALRRRGFAVSLIPHTLAVTTLGRKRPRDEVNIEVDILAKYVERLMAGWSTAAGRHADGAPA